VKTLLAMCCAVFCFGFASFAFGQDAVKTDPTHYKVEFENDKVRILRFHYGPHEKSIMHSHPDTVAVFLTDGKVTFHMPDGKTVDASGKAGMAQFSPAQVHLPENVGDAAMDGVVIELKTPAAMKMK